MSNHLIDLAIAISRPSPAAALNLNDGVKYELVEWNPPGVTWRRVTSEGDYQHGRRLISATRDVLTLSGVVRVRGTSWTNCAANANALVAALSQFTYTVTDTTASVVRTYTCEPADVARAGGFSAEQAALNTALYSFQIPAVAGGA